MLVGELANWAKAQPLMAAIAVLVAIPGLVVSFIILAAMAGVLAPVLIPAALIVMVRKPDKASFISSLSNFPDTSLVLFTLQGGMYVTRGAQATLEKVLSPRPKKKPGLAPKGMFLT